jgi:hypothetical protein
VRARANYRPAICDPLEPEELELLEKQLLADGCLDPIITWAMHDDTILDGKHRYVLCQKHGIPFKTKALKIDSREGAIAWIAAKQLGRRNVPLARRALLAARLVNTTRGGSKAQNCALVSHEKAAEIGGVSERTIDDARKINESGAAALVEAVKAKDVSITTAAALAELPKSEQKKIVSKGPEAAKKAAAKIKEKKKSDEPKQYDDEFDTAKIEKQKTKPGKVKGFDDELLKTAFRELSQAIDEHYKGLLSLYEQRFTEVGGDARLHEKAVRAAKIAQGKSHDAVNDALGAYKAWKQ